MNTKIWNRLIHVSRNSIIISDNNTNVYHDYINDFAWLLLDFVPLPELMLELMPEQPLPELEEQEEPC